MWPIKIELDSEKQRQNLKYLTPPHSPFSQLSLNPSSPPPYSEPSPRPRFFFHLTLTLPNCKVEQTGGLHKVTLTQAIIFLRHKRLHRQNTFLPKQNVHSESHNSPMPEKQTHSHHTTHRSKNCCPIKPLLYAWLLMSSFSSLGHQPWNVPGRQNTGVAPFRFLDSGVAPFTSYLQV